MVLPISVYFIYGPTNLCILYLWFYQLINVYFIYGSTNLLMYTLSMVLPISVYFIYGSTDLLFYGPTNICTYTLSMVQCDAIRSEPIYYQSMYTLSMVLLIYLYFIMGYLHEYIVDDVNVPVGGCEVAPHDPGLELLVTDHHSLL